MTMEQRMDQLEKRNKRLTVALTMMAVAMVAVVTMAATGEKHGVFDIVTARTIFVTNDAGVNVVVLGATSDGDGLVQTVSAEGKKLVELGATVGGDYGQVATFQPNGKELVALAGSDIGAGTVTTYQPNGKALVALSGTVDGEAAVIAYQPNGKKLVELTGNDNGGLVTVFNKTDVGIAQMYADEYGNGVVWAGNRKGMGRVLNLGHD